MTKSSHILKMIDRNRSIRDGNFQYEDKEWLINKYINERMTLRGIAKEVNCSLRTIARWMKIHGIEVRTGKDVFVKDKSGPNSSNWKNGIKQLKMICSCGNKKSYASLQCRFCYYKSNSGKNNYNYKGISDIMSSIRAYIATNWRPKIYKRDLYTCQHCGDCKGGNLHAHHIITLSQIVSDLFKNINPNLKLSESRLDFISKICSSDIINDLDNGITLCEDCHAKVHKTIKYKHPLPRMYLKIKEENNVYV